MKNVINIILLAGLIGNCSLLFAMKKKELHYEEPTFVPRGLLVFLDDSEQAENRAGAVSKALYTAFSQNAGPIVVSSSLLANVLSEYNSEQFASQTDTALYKSFASSRQCLKYVLLKSSGFDPGKWIIKKINDSLNLLIPYLYLQKLQITIDAVNTYNPNIISTTELQLGLKINHMETIGIKDIKQPVEEYDFADYFINALYNDTTKTSNIFCVRSDYKNKNYARPEWSLYIIGHGITHHSIVDLKLQDFKKMLDFLESNITTNLLIYASCYAAGLNTELIYNDTTSSLQKTYPFAIVTSALTDAPNSFIISPGLSNGKLILTTFTKYDCFLDRIMQSQGIIDYEKVIECIFPAILQEGLTRALKDTPQIKLPGIEWFSVTAVNKEVISIGSILAQTRDKPLNIVKFFKTDPRALLLYARDIPFELVIDSDKTEAIISMIPGDAIHTIKKISSSKKDFLQIISWFMKIKELSVEKIFFIREIGNYKNIVVSNNEAFFSDNSNNALYTKDAYQKTIIPASDDNKKQYQDLLQKIQISQSTEKTKRAFESNIAPQDIEKLKGTLAQHVKKTTEQSIEKIAITKKERQDFIESITNYQAPQNPTINQAIVTRLKNDIAAGLDINTLSDELIDTYYDIYKKIIDLK